MYKIPLTIIILLFITNTAYSTPTIVAKVNGEPIYEKDLTASINLRFNKRKKFGASEQKSPEVAYALKMQVLNDLINSKALYQASLTENFPKKELVAIEKEVEQKILSLAHTFGSEKSYNEFLATKNSSLKEKRDYFKNTFLVQAYFDKKGLTNPKIPEADIKALYETQKNSFKIPEQAELSQVFIKVDKDTSPEEKKKSEKIAKEAKQSLMDGKNFSEVAESLKNKSTSEVTGGDRGFIKRGTLPSEVDSIVFSIMPNIISNVIESRFGYHVLMVTDKKPSSFTPYEKVRDFLLKYLENETVSQSVAEHTQMLRDKAKVEILLKK